MPNPLSPRQRDFAHAVAALTKRRGIPPTLAEVAKEISVSLPRAVQLADACQSRGVVSRERRVARSLRVVRPTKASS
jgi:SOS-response transcriptional repressor LexA